VEDFFDVQREFFFRVPAPRQAFLHIIVDASRHRFNQVSQQHTLYYQISRKIPLSTVTMSEDLRVKLAKSKVDQDNRNFPKIPHSRNFPPERWEKAREAYSNGYKTPEKRFPIIIRAENPLSSAEKLKELGDLPSVPEILKTATVCLVDFDEFVPEEVHICDISWEQLRTIQDRAETERSWVWFKDSKKVAWTVVSLKSKDNVHDENER